MENYRSDTIGELSAALSKAQGNFQSIKRSRTVEVTGTTKQGRDYKYTYNYAPLDEILNATRPALAENGLAILQRTDETERGTVLETMLSHSSGEWISSFKVLGTFDDPQRFGGALTYYRRYEISAILGISSEEDDDGNGATGREAKQQPKQERHQPVKPEPTKANGNGKPVEQAKAPAPTNAGELLSLVNSRVLVTYDNEIHLRNAIRQELNDQKWDYPGASDRDGWVEAYRLAKTHADVKSSESVAA